MYVCMTRAPQISSPPLSRAADADNDVVVDDEDDDMCVCSHHNGNAHFIYAGRWGLNPNHHELDDGTPTSFISRSSIDVHAQHDMVLPVVCVVWVGRPARAFVCL